MIAFTAQIYSPCDMLWATQLWHARIPSGSFGSLSCEALDLACNPTALCHVPEWDHASLDMPWKDWMSVSVVKIKAGEFYISPPFNSEELGFNLAISALHWGTRPCENFPILQLLRTFVPHLLNHQANHSGQSDSWSLFEQKDFSHPKASYHLSAYLYKIFKTYKI